MAIEVRAWVGNLGKCNEGELVGEWVEFPIDDEEWDAVLKRIGIGEPVYGNPAWGVYEEYFFADYDSRLPLYREYGMYPSREELDELAERAAGVEDEDVFLAILEDHASDLDEAFRVHERGDWILWAGCEDMSDVARRYCDDDTAFAEAPDFMRRHFDFRSYGEELESLGTFVTCDSGIVEIL